MAETCTFWKNDINGSLICIHFEWKYFFPQHPEKPEKTQNVHVVINNKGDIISAYRKIHLFDMDNRDTGVRLMESDYVEAGNFIPPPVLSPVGKIGLSIVIKRVFFYLQTC